MCSRGWSGQAGPLTRPRRRQKGQTKTPSRGRRRLSVTMPTPTTTTPETLTTCSPFCFLRCLSFCLHQSRLRPSSRPWASRQRRALAAGTRGRVEKEFQGSKPRCVCCLTMPEQTPLRRESRNESSRLEKGSLHFFASPLFQSPLLSPLSLLFLRHANARRRPCLLNGTTTLLQQ